MRRFNPRNAGTTATRRRLGTLLSGLGWLAIAAATLTPAAGATPNPPFGCLVCGPDGGIDALANVLLFVPLGMGLALAGVRSARAVALVAMTTVAVELLQLRVVTGRDTSLGDLMWNLAGGAAGYWAVCCRRALVVPGPRPAAWLAGTWAALWLVGTATTAWSLAPSFAETAWVAHLGAPVDAPPPTPLVVAARVGDLSLRTGWLRDNAPVRARLLAGAPIAAEAVVPVVGPSSANIVVLDDGRTEQVMASLRRSGNGATYYLRTRASKLRLRSPSFTLPGVFIASTDTVRLLGARLGGVVRVEAEGANVPARRTVRVSPNWGWSLLLPATLSLVDRMWWFTALWVAVFVFPIGYWAAQTGRPRGTAHGAAQGTIAMTAAAALLTPIAAFVLIPHAAGLAPAAWTEWAAWGLATALGLTAGALAQRHARRIVAPARADFPPQQRLAG